jgi:hypothetical protein
VPPFPARGEQAWRKYAVQADIPAGAPKVVIILDDMGVNRAMSEAAIGLPGPLTLAFLPYGSATGELVETARARGHELMVHMPMEPLNKSLDPGPDVLRTSFSEPEFMEALRRNLGAIEGYVGINNHMGSKLTQDRRAMERVMGELRRRGMLFIDSRTIHSSVAAEIAGEFHLPSARRDVFLDHYPDYESVMAALEKLEDVARKHGTAIGIGHPRAGTVRALYAWLPTLQEKGIALAPVSAAVRASPRAVVAAKAQALPARPE